jgi:hypothetical protein
MNDFAAQLTMQLAGLHHLVAQLTETVVAYSGGAHAPHASGASEATGAAPVVLREGSQPERVLSFLRQCPGRTATRSTLKQAFAQLGWNDNVLSGAISRLKDRGLLEVVGRGRYRARMP